MTMIEEPKTAF